MERSISSVSCNLNNLQDNLPKKNLKRPCIFEPALTDFSGNRLKKIKDERMTSNLPNDLLVNLPKKIKGPSIIEQSLRNIAKSRLEKSEN
jgi:hypothetical protein